MNVRFALFLIIICLLFVTKADCCSCFGKGKITVEDYNSYDWIFVGKLINEKPFKAKYHHRICSYLITKVYKGEISDSQIVEVCDAKDNGACGLGDLQKGSEYLIYASGYKYKGTSDCSRTTRVPIQSWPKDSVDINRKKNMHSFGRMYDSVHTNFHADTVFLNKHVKEIRKNGIQKFYNLDGKLSATGAYKNGKPEGHWRYYVNGEVVSQGKYIDGERDSMWVEPFMETSVYIKEYKKGIFTQREVYMFEGRIAGKTEPVGNGDKWVKYDYHNNGQVRYIDYAKPPVLNNEGWFEDPVSHGMFKMFNKKGVVLQQGEYSDGHHEGLWKYYYENGKLRMEGKYINGKKTSTWKIYYPNGTVKASGSYEIDKKKGDWKYFNEKGIEISSNPDMIKEDEDWYTYSGVKN